MQPVGNVDLIHVASLVVAATLGGQSTIIAEV